MRHLRTQGFVRTTERSSGPHPHPSHNPVLPTRPQLGNTQHHAPGSTPALDLIKPGPPSAPQTDSRASSIGVLRPLRRDRHSVHVTHIWNSYVQPNGRSADSSTGGAPTHLRSPASSHHLRHPPATTPALNQKQPGVNQLPSSDWAECATCDGGLGFAEAQAAPDLSRSTLVRDSGQELRRQLRAL